MNEDTLRAMYDTMRHILKVESRKGGNGRKAPKHWLLGGRGKDTPCPRCGGELESTTVGGRTAWFCPACQPRDWR
ncbi:MAG: zinc finger domain-containing protein [Phycisphaerae bacterium]